MSSRRRRRHHEEEQDNHDRWLISYADFVTLLFAFFVVMYAISSVSEGKYRVLSDSMVSAFHNAADPSAGPKSADPAKLLSHLSSPKLEVERQVARERMSQMAVNLMQALGPLMKEGKVRVTEGVQWVSVEINASLLFAPGDAQLGASATAVLRSVAQVLTASEYPVSVEGHTDNTPISNLQFPSNWELSVVRASTVVRLFQDIGVAPWRLTATGYGEQRPVASNATPEGKARNRRVNITIDAPVGPDPVPLAEHKNGEAAAQAPGSVAPSAGTPALTVPGQPGGGQAAPMRPDAAVGVDPLPGAKAATPSAMLNK